MRNRPSYSIAAGLVIGVGMIVVSLACTATQPQRSSDSTAAEDLPVLWEKSGTYSRIARPIRIVARDRATLAQIPLTEVPVDFDSQMVLIAGLGPTPSNELGIRITRVWRQGPRVHVQERQIHPGFEESPGLHPASPWTVVLVPKSDLNVEGYSPQVPADLFGQHPSASKGSLIPR